ncbi:DUF1622 domain-containing protein [Teichococcus aestuarii]|uniref:DUF1622 domain-containing protein n=1 Tax=Teichococcus aestuarii TaxID=568898 RepID=UPI00361DB2B4
MVALEFTLAADILRTVVAPSWDDIGQLAAIATLRTVLNLFLEREIDQAAKRRGLRGGGRPRAGRRYSSVTRTETGSAARPV